MVELAQAPATPWEWHPHPQTWALAGFLLLGYMWAIARIGPRIVPPGRAPATAWQKAAFLFGVAFLVAGEEWPLHDLAENYLFSAHMVQHMLYAYVVPPLLLLGTPGWLLRGLLGRGLRRRLFRFFSHPLIAFVLLNGAIGAMHWSPIVQLQHDSAVFHLAFHLVLLGAGVLMWSNVIDPVPELARLTEPFKMLYLFLQSIIPTVPASFLTFSESALYRVYAEAPRVWGLSAVDDQRISGLIMKIGGGLLLWTVIAIVFFQWNAREEGSKEIDSVSWDDFERELEAWDMRK